MGTSFSSDVEYNSTEAAAARNLYTAFNVSTIPNAAIGQETYTEKWSEDWVEYWIEAEISPGAYPMNELIAIGAEFFYSHGKAFSILRSTSGIISVISSSIFIWMIMRSHDRLSTTQHRLLLGLCISDILSSLSHSTFNAMAPSEYNYLVWNARGNQATCTAQGFLITLGIFGGLYYNVSLNIYFLAVVKYKKGEEFIRAKMEPFLHGLPIAVAISYSIYLLVKQQYNDNGFVLYEPTNNAFHCRGHDVGEIREGFEIPCWRGIDWASTASISRMILMFIPVLIMMVSLGMIYSAVRTQEKRLARYGVGALRTNLRQQSASTPQQHMVQDEQSSGIWGRISTSLTALSTSLKSRTWSLRNTNMPVTRSNNVQSQSRAVMHKAFGYTFAWLLSYGLYIIVYIGNVWFWWNIPLVIYYILYICMPLQGLFNLLIFMYPKIMAAKKSKRSGETVSWCKAFSTAFWSKGKEGRNQRRSRSNLRGRSNRPLRKNRNENAASSNVKFPIFGGIKKKTTKKRNKERQEEEEKCEIQVPDNLNPNMTRAMYSATCPAIYERNIVPSSSTETLTAPTVNLSASIDDMDMVGVKKVDFAENVNVGNVLSDIVECSMESEDEEEGMSEAELENKEMYMTAAADVNDQKETSMENENEDEEKGISANEEEEMIEAEIGNKDEVPMAAADVKEISTEGE